jgi:tetratricopeptide (TPR) repeat protein
MLPSTLPSTAKAGLFRQRPSWRHLHPIYNLSLDRRSHHGYCSEARSLSVGRVRMSRLAHFASAVFFFLAICVIPPCVLAQRPTPNPAPTRSPGGTMSMEEQGVNLLVSVREATGMPLGLGAIVKLDSFAGVIHTTSSTRDGGMAMFSGVRPGDYNVEVSAAGYRTTAERVEVMGGGGANYTVYIYMQPEASGPTPNIPGSPTIMSPQLQSEIDKALQKMKKQQWDGARAHLEKAAKMAPANPDIQYLMGFLEYKQDHFDAARLKLQAAISLYPAHEKSYVTLGELELRAGRPMEASQALEKAYQLNGADWRMHFLLAHAYAAQKEFEKAEPHASRAAELAKTNVAETRLLLGRVLAGESKTQEAVRTFQSVMKDFPNTVTAEDARAGVAALERAVIVPVATKTARASPSANGSAMVTPAPDPAAAALPIPLPVVVVRAWAPPDIDGKEYAVAPDVTCALDEVIQRAARRASRQLANFERFMATEHIVHQEVDFNGNQGSPKSRDFTYLVFVEHAKDGTVFLEEERNGGQSLSEFPSHLASTGLVSLGVAVFREDLQKDLTYRCEGLGKWRGEAAWQVRFEQRKEAPSRLRTWRNSHGTFRIPLKGRVWVSANTYDVLHLETDLREPQRDISLDRDHLIVDYGPVKFEHDKTSLWLPWYAELFMELRGKRYHHRHTLTNYALFSVDTTNTISAPDEN